ncbi:hypothetical protein E8E12_001977 [Didymella heteroderae]|uniref:Zn(2)-C6 fungal-type domain-containing protein n=1 Tax=Didymella heteroderae TaxID=1769908 RepID=A0A9P5BZM7_9PLEO|nr:hypothetical protein E8E12_001977 [Didymella heteroderae]
MSTESSQLPACSKCRTRKVRCDRQAPKCGNCTKGNVACIIVDAVTGEQYARDFIHQLEQEEIRLKARFENGTSQAGTVTLRSETTERTPRGPLTGETVASHNGFVGDGSGLGFLHHILSEDKWQQHRSRILEQLADRPRIVDQAVVPHELPPLPEAEQLLENYFTRFHIHHTFLLRQEVLGIFYKMYGQSPPSDAPIPVVDEASVQDRFRLLMVFAISATTRYRNGLCTQHPYGYYLTAETLLSKIPLIKNTDAIQNLLLVARFGMYHHIGCSLWEISQVCMRQCIELGLHRSPSKAIEPLREQHHRRIFWECYVLDRYSSGILGRPFAVSEEDITVFLPVNAYDDHIATAGPGTLDAMYQPGVASFTEMSIFIVFIEQRRISSRIHTTFYTPMCTGASGGENDVVFKSIGKTYAAYVRFKSELDVWRLTVPAFTNPRSLYERADWHDFMYHKDMLLLTRGALHSLPSPLSTSSSSIRQLIMACHIAATRVIQLYGDLMDKGAITWTRSYFQVIFTAGLTITYCISLGVLRHSPDETQSQTEAVDTITRCGRILSYFKDRMPDAGSFAVVFDLLKEEYIAGLLGHASQNLDQNVGNDHINPDLTQGLVPPSDGDFNSMWSSMGSDLNGFGVYTDFE